MNAYICRFETAEQQDIAINSIPSPQSDFCNTNTQKIEMFQSVWCSLNDEEQRFIEMLSTKKLIDIEKKWGWSHGKVMRYRDKIRKKFIFLKKKRTFSNRVSSSVYEDK